MGASDRPGPFLADSGEGDTSSGGNQNASASPADTDTTAPTQASPGQARGLKQGTLIGRYLVIDELGKGGMGVVLNAYDPELDRRVAIKLVRLRSGLDGDNARSRLQREAQALAKLSHPNVITVHDVGTWHGDVFVAMEYVEGVTLAEWLVKDKPTLPEILKIFGAAGQGLAAAHAASLVHRNFKPQNVMIGNDGRVRVLDFGLARAADLVDTSETPGSTLGTGEQDPTLAIGDAGDPAAVTRPAMESSGPAERQNGPDEVADLTDEHADTVESPQTRGPAGLINASLTVAGSTMGTPAYMAPEQILGLKVGGRSDQFSFCAVLYEALFGERPFPGKNLEQIKEQILAGEITPPESAKVPARVRQIVLRGLSLRPRDRFASMQELLAALKAITRRRQQLRLALASAVAVGVLFVSWTTLSRGVVCEAPVSELAGAWDPQTKIAVERSFASTGAAHAGETLTRVQEILDAYGHGWRRQFVQACEDTFVQRIHSARVHDLRSLCLLRRRDALKALTQRLTGKLERGVVDRAARAALELPKLESCSDVAALMQAVAPPEQPDSRAQVTALRAELEQVRVFENLGQYTKGVDLATQLLSRAGKLDYLPVQAEAYAALGSVLERDGDAEKAESALRMAARLAAEAGDSATHATAWRRLLWVVGYRQTRLEEAALLGDMVDTAITLAGDDPWERGRYLNIRGVIAKYDGELGAARSYYQLSHAVLKEAYGEKHVKLAAPLNNMGLLLLETGEYDQALRSLQQTLAIEEKAYGKNHPEVGLTIDNIGVVLAILGRYQEALNHHDRARQIAALALGGDHPLHARALERMCVAQTHLGYLHEAEANCQRALAILATRGGETQARHAETLDSLGVVYTRLGRYEEARRALHESRTMLLEVVGSEHVLTAMVERHLGETLLAARRPAEARRYLEAAVRFFESHKSDRHQAAAAQFALAKALAARANGRQAARRLAQKALAHLQVLGPSFAARHDLVRDWLQNQGWAMD